MPSVRRESAPARRLVIAVAFAVEKLLPLAYHTKIFIIKDTQDDWKLLQNCSCKFLNIHLHTAVTGDNDDRFVRISDFGSDTALEDRIPWFQDRRT